MINNIQSTVVSSRVRLARNLADLPFPNRLQDVRKAKSIVKNVYEAASGIGLFHLYSMSEISDTVAQSLCDDHLISPELAANKICGAVVIAEEDGDLMPGGKFSVMINEEDHLREQYIVKGLNLSYAYMQLSAVDDEFSKRLRFAYDPRFGYLTACPTNLGTGLRASVMLFLPGLTRKKKMTRLIREISRLGHTVRGVYGEGSRAEGYMYQISNEVTLGVDEEYILSEVQRAVLKIVNFEAHARKELCADGEAEVKDECCRAYGILCNCETISYKEFLRLASDVKLGVALGFIDTNDFAVIDEFIAKMRPSNLDVLRDIPFETRERDLFRALKCRQFFSKLRRK